MALTIISVKESQGEYMNRPYHNFVVSAMNPETTNPKIVAGCEVVQLKIKADEFPIVLGRAIGALGDPNVTKVQDIIGLYVLPVFDQWGKCTDFSLAVPEKKK